MLGPACERVLISLQHVCHSCPDKFKELYFHQLKLSNSYNNKHKAYSKSYNSQKQLAKEDSVEVVVLCSTGYIGKIIKCISMLGQWTKWETGRVCI